MIQKNNAMHTHTQYVNKKTEMHKKCIIKMLWKHNNSNIYI